MGLLAKAARSALGGGIPGAIAMVLQVLLLMWLRTTVNYQMVKGMGTLAAMRHLYAEAGGARVAAFAMPTTARAVRVAIAVWCRVVPWPTPSRLTIALHQFGSERVWHRHHKHLHRRAGDH